MASLISCNRDGFTAVYDDRLLPLLEALGHVLVRRASEVEWDAVTHEWVAVHLDSGTEIARGRVRSDVIAAEVQWLEQNVIAGKLGAPRVSEGGYSN